MLTNKRTVYVLICLGCITISFNVAAITAAIPVISRDLGLADLLVSQIIPYYLIPYGVGALIYAPLSRFVSYRMILFFTMGLYALSCLMCGLAGHINHLFIGRIAMGISGAAAIPLGLMIIGELFEKEIRGRLVGVFFGCSFVASLAGICLSGIADWRWLFFIPTILGALTALNVFTFGAVTLNRKHSGHINYFQAYTTFNIRKVFIYIFIISFLYHGVHKWYGVYLSRIYGYDKLAISVFFILTLIGGLAGQLLGGVLTDKKGRGFSCYAGVAGLGLGVIFLAREHHGIILGVILTLISAFWTMGHNGISTVLTDFSDEHRPIIASLNSSIRFISGGLGFFLSSLFVAKSFSLTFFAIGCLILLLLFILPIILPSEEEKKALCN